MTSILGCAVLIALIVAADEIVIWIYHRRR
jgi:hypothetical protein